MLLEVHFLFQPFKCMYVSPGSPKYKNILNDSLTSLALQKFV